jgi:solute carrier family 39 (zinc transporter), member 1/2/3
MSLLIFKIMASVFIFIISTLAGLLPMQLGHFHVGSRHITDSITNGIFLGVAIFHMLPDAQAGFNGIGLDHYPYAILLCFSGFIFLQLVKYSMLYFKQAANNTKLNGTIILVILFVHSLMEGATLGINTTIPDAFVIFIAIMVHKSCDSFALANTLKRYQMLPNHHVLIILLYALITPLGIGIASTVIAFLSKHSAILATSSLNALAAGTFLYIGALDALIQQFNVKRLQQNIMDFVALLMGMGLMGFLAIWL